MTFQADIAKLKYRFKREAALVATEKWQGVPTRPEHATYELPHVFLKVPMQGEENLDYYRSTIKPNLPWADEHFELDRVCGEPLNPGLTWQTWPWGHSADKFRGKNGQFNHTYAERYWPRFAPLLPDGHLPGPREEVERLPNKWDLKQREGIRYPYGDLQDVVRQLAREPHTRQCILPVFHPEDTGAIHGGRIPCSLAYQFFIRNGKIDVSYWLRSCDLHRHFADDIYLTVRLLLWVLQEARKYNSALSDVRPGQYVMLITSLHCFVNDYKEMFGG